MLKQIAAFGLSAACFLVFADTTKFVPVGNWRVMITKDAMSDDLRCSAVPNAYHDSVIFSSLGVLLISAKKIGGYEESQYRFDDEKTTEMTPILPSEDAEWWAFWDSDRVYASKRLRVRILNPRQDENDFDIDLRSLKKVNSVFKANRCPA